MGVEERLSLAHIETRLSVSEKEWRIANQYFKTHPNSKRLNRKKIEGLNHSFWCIHINGKYEVLAMGRAKTFRADNNLETTEGVLGYGSFGVVRIMQAEDGRQYAVKVKPSSHDSSKKKKLALVSGCFKGKFEYITGAPRYINTSANETHILEATKKLHETIEMSDRKNPRPWIGNSLIKSKEYQVMNLVKGEELYLFLHRMLQRTIDPIILIDILWQCARSIKNLHDRNIIHGDIKEANFLIDNSGSILTIEAVDFGFALELNHGADFILAENAFGTPYYLAPEIYDSETIRSYGPRSEVLNHMYSKASDMFAFGKMIQHIIQGQEYNFVELYDLSYQLTHEDPRMRPTIDQVLSFLKVSLAQQQQKVFCQYKEPSSRSRYMLFRRNNNKTDSKTLHSILKSYNEGLYVSDEDTAQKIILVMQRNLTNCEKEKILMIEQFHRKILKATPIPIRSKILELLDLEEHTDILQRNSDESNKFLSEKLTLYTSSDSGSNRNKRGFR